MTLVECIYNQVRASYFQCPIKCFLEVSTYLLLYDQIIMFAKGGFMSEDAGEFLHCQIKYSKSLSWAENLNFPPKTVNNLP